MNQKELISILVKVIFLIFLLFFIFIFSLNLFRFITYIKKVDHILQKMEQDDSEIPLITSNFKDNDFYLKDIAHRAEELGYKDRLKDINGSEWGEGINILIIGSDKKKFHKEKSRSDVIIVLRIIKNGKILSLSIPRDSLITFSKGEYKGYKEKIGHSLFWGGMENLKRNVESIMGSLVHRVVIVDNFRSFEAFLSIIGGVDMDKFLYGKLGIQWIRNRNFKHGDIERCKRQQIFIKNVIKKLWEITHHGNYFYCLFAYKAFKKIFETDIQEKDFMKLIYLLKVNNFSPDEDIYLSVLNGKFSTYNSILSKRNNLSCWLLEEKDLENIRLLFYSDNTDFFIYEDKNINFLAFTRLEMNILFQNIKKNFIHREKYSNIIKDFYKD